jgi:hypothetical protein
MAGGEGRPAAPAGAVRDWGTRLSDRVRAALEAGDADGARRLVAEGDGAARSLEKEYALMYRGLGITIRILLELLGEAVARQAEPGRPAAEQAAAECVARFRREMTARLREVYPGAPPIPGEAGGAAEPAGAASLEDERARAAGLLEAGEAIFGREQAARAAEALGALDRGDLARARAVVDRKESGEYLPLHDRLIRFMAEIFGCVLTALGPEELLRFHRATAERQRAGFEKWELLPPEEFARVSAFLLKQHMGQVEVREEALRFTIVQTPCGSGGRLRLAGAYAGAGALPFVEAQGPLTAGQGRFPVYCSHCPVWNALWAIEAFGRPQWVFDEPARPDGSCTLHIYKDRNAVPADALRRLGLAPREA